MERRNFLNTLFSASLGVGFYRFNTPDAVKETVLQRASFSVDDNKVSYFLKELAEPVKIIQITDTHLWMDDERGDPFRDYSQRMAKAYNITKHFRTGEDTNPAKCFEETLEMAYSNKADLIALTGDIFSFPSEAAIEWALEKLEKTGIPYVYVSGNHDWHYEGMKGSSQELRETWIKKRLMKLCQGNDPMMAAYMVKGIKVLTIDNSTYEILPEQLGFLRKHEREDTPFILMMHIPIYAPGRNYGVGDPLWGASKDRGYEVERREKWPEQGHSKVTMDFYNELLSSTRLMGIFAGHIHRQYFDMVRGIPQFVANANATGAYTEINFLNMTGA